MKTDNLHPKREYRNVVNIDLLKDGGHKASLQDSLVGIRFWASRREEAFTRYFFATPIVDQSSSVQVWIVANFI
jgi:hypothetical protein